MSDAAVRPAAGPPRPYSFPDFVRHELPGGLTVLVAPARRLPICALSIVVDAGAELDPPGEEGRALLTARGLAEGTRDYPGIAFTERLERIGAALEAAADWDSAHLTLAVGAARLPAALDLLAGVLMEPAFPEDDVERLREERLSEIVQVRSEPRGLANEVFARVVYAAGSRYASPLGGSQSSVRRLDRGSLQRHHSALYVPARTTVIAAGDVNADDLLRTVEERFSSWRVPAASVEPRRSTEAPAAVRVSIVDRPDAPQSELRVGHASVPRSHPDYFPLTLMNAVLGGLFSSRINLNLREEHAYTYGAHSGFDWRRGAGPFVVRTAVESGVTGGAVAEILKEVNRIREAPVTESEISLARDYLAGVFPVRFETSLAIAAALAQMVTYSLPSGFYDEYRRNIAAVSAGDILRVAREQLDPARLRVVAVGGASNAREQLASLGLGDVEELGSDESGDELPAELAVAHQRS